MNPTTSAIRAGWRRGLIELRQSVTNGQDLFGHLFWPTILLIVMFFLRDNKLAGGSVLLGSLMLPSVLGMNLAMNGLIGIGQYLAVDREDGTLLRAKATPNGLLGYLVGKIVLVAGVLLGGLLLVLIPGSFFVDGLTLGSPASWLSIIGVVLLGMLATLPFGAIFGSLVTSPRSLGAFMLPLSGFIAISGIFYPITAMPGWLQWIAQVSPIYWLGLGMRSALLPDSAVTVELGHSWRHLETVGVLGIWAVAGMLLAPVVLRRMARRESGSSVLERRERALQRVG
jgi:ABC-2 type transport system permease protein